MRHLSAWLALSILACTSGVVAGQAVLFSDGREMQVEAVAFEGAVAVLTLEGGGRISTPADRIARLDAMEPARGSGVAAPVDRATSAAWRRAAGPYAGLIEDAAARHGLDPVLLTAMASVESAFDPGAVSPVGAAGLMQLMPDTARRFGVRDVFDVSENVDGGARYLSWLLERYDGQTELALAGYNAGEGAVDRHRGVPPYRETREYVSRVLQGAGRLGALAQ